MSTNDFLTLDYLKTFSGAVATVYIIVQFTKSALKRVLPHYVLRIYSLILAWLIQGFILVVSPPVPTRSMIEHIGLAILNGFLISMTATGIHETTADPLAKKTRKNPNSPGPS